MNWAWLGVGLVLGLSVAYFLRPRVPEGYVLVPIISQRIGDFTPPVKADPKPINQKKETPSQMGGVQSDKAQGKWDLPKPPTDVPPESSQAPAIPTPPRVSSQKQKPNENARKDSWAVALGISGKVSLTMARPIPRPIRMTPDCRKLNPEDSFKDESVSVDESGGLANVLVYLAEGAKAKKTPQLPPKVLDQKGCRYFPRVLGLEVGQELSIQTQDPLMHNVHAMATGNAGFNFVMATAGQLVTKRFMKPERVIKIKCDVHGWMTAYIGVFDHPYFAVTDSQGNYSIRDIPPPGEYSIEAWHEKLGIKSQRFSISDASLQVLRTNFTY